MGWQKRWLDRLKRLFGRGDPPPSPEGPPIRIPQVKISRSRTQGAEATIEIPDDTEGETAPSTAVDTVALRQRMLNHLEMDQLRRICADLGIDFDALAGGKGRKVMAIMQRAGEAEKLDALVAACARHSDDPALFSE